MEHHSVLPVKELEYVQAVELEFTYETVKHRVLAELPIPWINETLTPGNETIAKATGLLVGSVRRG